MKSAVSKIDELSYRVGGISMNEYFELRNNLTSYNWDKAQSVGKSIKENNRRMAPDALVYAALHQGTESGYRLLREALEACVVDDDRKLVSDAMANMFDGNAHEFLRSDEMVGKIRDIIGIMHHDTICDLASSAINLGEKPHIVNWVMFTHRQEMEASVGK